MLNNNPPLTLDISSPAKQRGSIKAIKQGLQIAKHFGKIVKLGAVLQLGGSNPKLAICIGRKLAGGEIDYKTHEIKPSALNEAREEDPKKHGLKYRALINLFASITKEASRIHKDLKQINLRAIVAGPYAPDFGLRSMPDSWLIGNLAVAGNKKRPLADLYEEAKVKPQAGRDTHDKFTVLDIAKDLLKALGSKYKIHTEHKSLAAPASVVRRNTGSDQAEKKVTLEIDNDGDTLLAANARRLGCKPGDTVLQAIGGTGGNFNIGQDWSGDSIPPLSKGSKGFYFKEMINTEIGRERLSRADWNKYGRHLEPWRGGFGAASNSEQLFAGGLDNDPQTGFKGSANYICRLLEANRTGEPKTGPFDSYIDEPSKKLKAVAKALWTKELPIDVKDIKNSKIFESEEKIISNITIRDAANKHKDKLAQALMNNSMLRFAKFLIASKNKIDPAALKKAKYMCFTGSHIVNLLKDNAQALEIFRKTISNRGRGFTGQIDLNPPELDGGIQLVLSAMRAKQRLIDCA